MATYEFKALQEGISFWTRSLWSDGGLADESFTLNGEKLKIERSGTGETRILFNRPLKKGEIYHLVTQATLKGAFSSSNEFWEIQFSFPIKDFKFRLIFPNNYIPKNIYSLLNQTNVVEEVQGMFLETEVGHEYKVSRMRVPPGSRLDVKWEWSPKLSDGSKEYDS